MAVYNLMDGVAGRPGPNGPAAVTATSGPWLVGVNFSVTGQMMWLTQYRIWVPANGDTTARKFALWNIDSHTAATQVLVPGSAVTSGTMTLGAWNTVNLAAPLQLAPGTMYVAAAGWTATNGISNTVNQFGTAEPFAGGITNGPLTMWSGTGGTHVWPLTNAFGNNPFSNVLGADPAVAMPNNVSGDDNLWVDVTVSDTAPAGYTGSYRIWPNMWDGQNYSLDTANNFTLGQAFTLSKTCTLNNIWFYSPATVTQLPTGVGVFTTGGVLAASNLSPSWVLESGGAAAAAGGWMKAACAGTLGAGTYWACVVNNAGVPAIWNAAEATYWSTLFGSNGLVSGPMTAPSNAAAPGPGQNSYHPGAALTLPDTNAGPFLYYVDAEVTPVAVVAGGGDQRHHQRAGYGRGGPGR